MGWWYRRNRLSRRERFVRSFYYILRDELDEFLIQHALIESYKNFMANNEEYPFVDKKELKPRARVIGKESPLHNSFIVIFYENILPNDLKKSLHFFDKNRVTKENLSSLVDLKIVKNFSTILKYFETKKFFKLVKELLHLDYALLIQKDETVKAKPRYALTHFHVRVDWPVQEAAEDLGRYLRYISKDLYEKGEKYALSLQEKLFEYYSFHYRVGGRRTAALVAAQLLRRLKFLSTVYVSSSESRALVRISETDVSKYVLLPLEMEDFRDLCKSRGIKEDYFLKNYGVIQEKDRVIVIFRVIYTTNEHSRPPIDGKLRELVPEYQWLNVTSQQIIPNFGPGFDCRPLTYRTIYG